MIIGKITTILLIIFQLLILSCSTSKIYKHKKNIKQNITLRENDIVRIPLSGEIAKRKSEISGLCWFDNKLILLPQFPNRFSHSGFGKIYYIGKSKILNFLNGKSKTSIKAEYYFINTNNFSDLFKKGSGFEAVTFHNNKVFFTIESFSFGKTVSYLISGKIDTVSKKINLDKNTLTLIPNKINLSNMGNESVLFYNGEIIPIYEANGKNINPKPTVAVYDTNNHFVKKIRFPNIEYRITDVTSVDKENKFWAVNYFYPGEKNILKPAEDRLIEKYGIGKSNEESDYIERIVQFKIDKEKIKLTENLPIYLKIPKTEGRNWEGIAELDSKGFLLVTDTYPETILAFVKK